MKVQKINRLFKVGIALTLTTFCLSKTTMATEQDTWQTEIGIYAWLASIDGTTKFPDGSVPGNDISVDASDILEDLNMIFMGNIESKYNKWSLLLDVIYMDLGDDADKTFNTPSGTSGSGNLSMDISSWVINGIVGYEVLQSDKASLSIIGGVRYLSLDVDVKTSLVGPLQVGRSSEVSDSESLFDGVVGIRGRFILNENWYIPYHADIGGGGSDLTWQLFAGVGYQFSWGDIRLGYRHLQYELDDEFIMEEMILSGPVLGVGFRF